MTTGDQPGLVPWAHRLFEQPWWLEAVAPGQWDEVLVMGDAGEVQARLPFVRKQRLGITALTAPALTPTLGPWVAPAEVGEAKALAREHKLIEGLIAALPPFDLFHQAFHPSVMNWLPFHWAGFAATVMYTYRLEDLSDAERIWSGFRSNIRREVRKAEKAVTVRTDLGLHAFLDVNAKTFGRQGRRLPYTRELVERVDAACEEREARRIFFAVDDRDRVHAAVYIVWDAECAYYLMGGGDPELRTSGATSLLMWEAIRFCSEVTRGFDFEGSMIPSIERFFRAFGTRQVPYLRVSKANRRARASGFARRLAAATRGGGSVLRTP